MEDEEWNIGKYRDSYTCTPISTYANFFFFPKKKFQVDIYMKIIALEKSNGNSTEK